MFSLIDLYKTQISQFLELIISLKSLLYSKSNFLYKLKILSIDIEFFFLNYIKKIDSR